MIHDVIHGRLDQAEAAWAAGAVWGTPQLSSQAGPDQFIVVWDKGAMDWYKAGLQGGPDRWDWMEAHGADLRAPIQALNRYILLLRSLEIGRVDLADWLVERGLVVDQTAVNALLAGQRPPALSQTDERRWNIKRLEHLLTGRLPEASATWMLARDDLWQLAPAADSHQTSLALALRHGNLAHVAPWVSRLLDLGASATEAESPHRPPLHAWAYRGRQVDGEGCSIFADTPTVFLAVWDRLVQAGANPDQVGDDQTPQQLWEEGPLGYLKRARDRADQLAHQPQLATRRPRARS